MDSHKIITSDTKRIPDSLDYENTRMPCTYCNNAFHTVHECEHPDSVKLYSAVVIELKYGAFEFWNLYKRLNQYTIGELQMVMVTLCVSAPIDYDKATLIARIIEGNFNYETSLNNVTDTEVIACATDIAFLMIKRTLADTTEEEMKICNKLLSIDVENLIFKTTKHIFPNSET